jgi:hypothetical protein
MTPIPLRDIDYFALAKAFTLNGLSVHQTFDQDPEIYRFEFSDLSRDIHVWLFPLKAEVVVIHGWMEGADPEEESFDHVPAPSEVRFTEYIRLFDVLRKFAYSGVGCRMSPHQAISLDFKPPIVEAVSRDSIRDPI